MRFTLHFCLIFSALLFLPLFATAQDVPDLSEWEVHDTERPAPPVVTPGTMNSAPSDAIVLF